MVELVNSAGITACLLTCQRPANLTGIVSALMEQGVRHVIVWNNSAISDDEVARYVLMGMAFHPGNGQVIGVGANRWTFGRYLAVQAAKTDLVYVQDDDVAPDNLYFLIRRHLDTGRLATYLDPSHLAYSQQHYKLDACKVDSWETLVGWGAVFPAAWASVLLGYLAFFGRADDTFFRKADRIFTMLLCRQHEEIESNVKHLAGATGEDALYRRSDHWQSNGDARDRCRQLLNMIGMPLNGRVVRTAS